MSGARATYMRDRAALRDLESPLDLLQEAETALDHELTVLPGHCPNCSLEYHLAEMLAGHRAESDHCSLCEDEEGMER